MRKLLSATLLSLSLLGVSGALWLAKADAAMGWRARLPQLAEQAEAALAAHPACESDPGLAPDALLAALRADLDDPGCPGDQRLLRLIVGEPSPRFEQELLRLLASRKVPERARLRVSLSALRRAGELTEPVRAELRRAGLSPRSQERLLAEMSELFGPEVVDSLLRGGGAPRYDAGHSLAARRLAGGDLSARAAVIEALEHELTRPTLPTSDADPGLSARRARLAQAALAGLGLDMPFLRALAERQARGLPMPGGVPGPLAMALADAPPPCEVITEPACGRRLIELMELPPDPFEGWLSSESIEPTTPRAALPEPWGAWVAALSETPELVEEAAAWVLSAPERPAGRLLGVVANRDHAYGPGPLAAGQRGDPSDAVRYGGATPAATAVAARALAAAAEVELEVSRWEGQLVLESGSLRVFLGPRGPGTGAADPARFESRAAEPVSDETLVAMAWAEQVAGRLAAGDVEGAAARWDSLEAALAVASPEAAPPEASSPEAAPPEAASAVPASDPDPLDLSPGSALHALRGSLLAARGLQLFGLRGPAASTAAAWAASQGHPSVAEAIAASQPGAPSLEALLEEAPAVATDDPLFAPPPPVIQGDAPPQ